MNKIASLIIIWMVIVSTSCTGKQSSPDDSKTDNTNDANNTTAVVQTLSSENWIALFTLIAPQLYINIPVDDIKTAFSTFEKVTEGSFMGSEIAGSSLGMIGIKDNSLDFYNQETDEGVKLYLLPAKNEVALFQSKTAYSENEVSFYQFNLENNTITQIPNIERLEHMYPANFFDVNAPSELINCFAISYSPHPEGIVGIAIITESTPSISIGDYQLYEKRVAEWDGSKFSAQPISKELSKGEKVFVGTFKKVFGLTSQEALDLYYRRVTPLKAPFLKDESRFCIYKKEGDKIVTFTEFIPNYLGGAASTICWTYFQKTDNEALSLLLHTEAGIDTGTLLLFYSVNKQEQISLMEDIEKYMPEINATDFFYANKLSDKALTALRYKPIEYSIEELENSDEVCLIAHLYNLYDEDEELSTEFDDSLKTSELYLRWNGNRFERDENIGRNEIYKLEVN